MLQTEHYQLSQWDFEDQILMVDFNNDNKKIDTALHGLAEQTAGKADASTVNSLAAAVNTKAEKSALAAEQTARQNADNTEKAAREAADGALAKRAGMQLIKTFALSGEDDLISLAMDDVDWTEWCTVHLVIAPVLTGGSKYKCDGSFTFDTGGYRVGRFHMVLYPIFDPGMLVSGHYWPKSQGTGYLSGSTIFQNLSEIAFYTDTGNFQPGTTVTIWGAR